MKKKFISVVGLGYVGLPLVVELAKFFNCIGYDIDKKKIQLLKKKVDSTNEIKNKNLLKKVFFSSNVIDLKKSNIYILCIPTPIYKNKRPDLSLLKKASILVAKNLKKGDLVIYESTVYPGVTEEICIPILEFNSKLKWKKDFNVAYSPERINPGDKFHSLSNTFKIISGDTKQTLKRVKSIYKKITKVYVAESIKIAEASKVIENAQRDINIAFVNELSVIFSKMNINIHSVLEAASTKWNFLDFKPGLVGGHCIGIDPYYLAYKAKKINIKPNILLAGREINERMTSFIFNRICRILKPKNKILFMGVSFKENCGDIRNSKNLELLKMLINKKFNITINDELISKNNLKKLNLLKNHLNLKKLQNKKFDAIILPQVHDYLKNNKFFKIEKLLKKNGFIYDLKNEIDISQISKKNINYLNI